MYKYNYPYRLYARDVMKELSKSNDEEVINKFINELCKLSTLKQYEKYNTPKLRQSEIVRDIVKWLDEKCKTQKGKLNYVKEQKKNGDFYWVDDMGEGMVREEEIRLETLVDIKISIEKYMRKLRHNENKD